MAQRMESVAAPGGVMLSEATARLVEDCATLGEPQLLHIKGFADAVCPRPLLAVEQQGHRVIRRDTTLVGRDWELAALTGLLDRSMNGHGSVAGVVGRVSCQRSPIPGHDPAASGGFGCRQARRRGGVAHTGA